MGSPRDYKNTIVPNWCPGCGDFGIQNAIAAVCAAKGWPNEDIVLISGIGCSSRIGGYQYCYGAHTTHGRALPFAQGIKCANKDIHMIVCSGDGDSYAIGFGTRPPCDEEKYGYHLYRFRQPGLRPDKRADKPHVFQRLCDQDDA